MNNPGIPEFATPLQKPSLTTAPATGDRLRVAHPITVSTVDVHKSYHTGNGEVSVLRGVDVSIREGEFVAITGSSGSGKSTLLHLLGTLDEPDQGEIWIGQSCINRLRSGQRDQLRNREIGLIFQFYHLLPELTALENVLLPCMIGGGLRGFWRHRRKNRERAADLLNKVGLGHRRSHYPRQMSGGEMQRVAIARSLVAHPGLLLADEPTGNLDRKNSDEIMRTLMQLRDEECLTIIMVTHDDEIARQADRTIRLVEGRVDDVA